MSDASETKCCPKCQAPLPGDAPQGLCPKCLLAAASIPTEAGQPANEHPAPPTLEAVAAAFPQLEILELIGQGGMGFVFKARQPKLDRFVALKILPQSLAADPAFAERFSREGRVLAKLNHPNIVTIHDFGQANGFFYLLMEFVDGVNLRQAMKVGRFTPAQALAIVPKICEALQFAHNEGILHRDIKPENILLDSKGRVKIADFGIAKLVGDAGNVGQAFQPAGAGDFPVARSETGTTGLESPVSRQAGKPAPRPDALTETGKVLGTPHYMAPEQLAHPQDVDQRADIYSLGVVFYEMLTGDLPTGHFALPSEKSAADPRVDQVVLRALEKERERRQHSAAEVKSQVETIAATSLGSSRRQEALSAKSEIRNPESEMAPRFSRTALVSTCLGMLALVLLALSYIVDGVAVVNPVVDSELVSKILAVFGAQCLLISTIFGWIAVTQIRHSAGRLSGLGLAVFDGLLFPLLGLYAAIAGLVRAFQLGNWEALLIWLPVGGYVVRRTWRAVNRPPSDASSGTPRAPRRANPWITVGALVVGIVLLGAAVAAFFPARNENSDIASLVNQPHKLRSLPNATVIQVGLAEPKSAWAWKELEKRSQAGQLDRAEANQIVDGFASWMRRQHPQGYNRSLDWFGQLLDKLDKHPLVGGTNALAFLDAYYGNPSIEPLPRIRESESSLRLTCDWRSSWLNQHSFGFELLNEMRSISVDGTQVPVQDGWRKGRWKDDSFTAALDLPQLAPGKHLVRCEVESAFVATSQLAGLASDATSEDWPPAKRRWTRVCEAEFMVYAADAEIVKLMEDPGFNPVAGGALSCRQIIIRPNSGRLTATVSFNAHRKPEQPVSVDVTLRLAGQTIKCGKLLAVTTVNRSAANDPNMTVEIESLDSQIKEAEILLTPNPKWVEEYPYIDRIWGKEIVISNVPLSRQDLYGAKPAVTAEAPASMLSFGPVIERVLSDAQSAYEPGLLNLETGRTFTRSEVLGTNQDTSHTPLALTQPGAANALSLQGIGIGGNLDARSPGLLVWECSTYAIGTLGWNAADKPDETQSGWDKSLRDILDQLPRPFPGTCNILSGEPPQTLLLKTRSGRQAVLQITGFTENPRGVKLRYRLVQSDRK